MDIQWIDEPSTSTASFQRDACKLAKRIPRSFDVGDYLLDLVPQNLTYDYLTLLRKILDDIDKYYPEVSSYYPYLPEVKSSIDVTDHYLSQAAAELVVPRHYQFTPFVHYSRKQKCYVNPMVPDDPNPARLPLQKLNSPVLSVVPYQPVYPPLVPQPKNSTQSGEEPRPGTSTDHQRQQQQQPGPAYHQQPNPFLPYPHQANRIIPLQQQPNPFLPPEAQSYLRKLEERQFNQLLFERPPIRQEDINVQSLPHWRDVIPFCVYQPLALPIPGPNEERRDKPFPEREPIYYHHSQRFSSMRKVIRQYAAEFHGLPLTLYICGNREQYDVSSEDELMNITASDHSSELSFSDEDDDEDEYEYMEVGGGNEVDGEGEDEDMENAYGDENGYDDEDEDL